MKNDKITEVLCSNCGHNIMEDNFKNYDYRVRLNALKLERNKEILELISKVVRLIKKNVPTDNTVKSEYFFYKRMESVRDTLIKIGIHRYLEGNHQYQGKGFMYLNKIIQYTETNSERQYELEQKRLGKLPKPQRKEDIDG